MEENQVVISVELDRELFNRDLTQLQTDIEKIKDISLTVNPTQVNAKIAEIKKSLQDTPVPINLQPNIIGLIAAINAIPSQSVPVDLKIDQAAFDLDALQLQQKRLEFGVAIKEKEGETFSSLVTQIRSRILGAANQFNTAKLPISIVESTTETLAVLKSSIDSRLKALKSTLEVALDLKPGELERIRALVRNAVVPPTQKRGKKQNTITSQADVPDVQAALNFDSGEEEVRNVRRQINDLKTLINTPAGGDFVGSLFDNQSLAQLKEFGKLLRDEFNIEGIKLNAKEPLRQSIIDALPEVERQLNEIESRFNQTFDEINNNPSNRVVLDLDTDQAEIDLNTFINKIPERETIIISLSEDENNSLPSLQDRSIKLSITEDENNNLPNLQDKTIKLFLDLTELETEVTALNTLIPETKDIALKGTISPETEASINELLAKLNATQNLVVNLVAAEAKKELDALSADRNISFRLSLANREEIQSVFSRIASGDETTAAFTQTLDSIATSANQLTASLAALSEGTRNIGINYTQNDAKAAEKIAEIVALLPNLKSKTVNITVNNTIQAEIDKQEYTASVRANFIPNTTSVDETNLASEITLTLQNAQAVAAINETLALIPEELRSNFIVTLAQEPKTGLAAKLEAIKEAAKGFPVSPDPVTFSFTLTAADDLTTKLEAIKTASKNLPKSVLEFFTFSLTAADDLESRLASIKTAATNLPESVLEFFTFTLTAPEDLETRLEAIKTAATNLPPTQDPTNFSFTLTLNREDIPQTLAAIKEAAKSLPTKGKELTYTITLAELPTKLSERLAQIQAVASNININTTGTGVADLNQLNLQLIETFNRFSSLRAELSQRIDIDIAVDSLSRITDTLEVIKSQINLTKQAIASLISDTATTKDAIDATEASVKVTITLPTSVELTTFRTNLQAELKKLAALQFTTELKPLAQKALEDERKRLQAILNESVTALKYATSLKEIALGQVRETLTDAQSKADLEVSVILKSSLRAIATQQINEIIASAQSLAAQAAQIEFNTSVSQTPNAIVDTERTRIQAYISSLAPLLFSTGLRQLVESVITTERQRIQEEIEKLADLRFATTIKPVTKETLTTERSRIQNTLNTETDAVQFVSDIKNVLKGSLETEQARIQSVVNSITAIRFPATVDVSEASINAAISLINSIPENTDRVRTLVNQNPIELNFRLIDIAERTITTYLNRVQTQVNSNNIVITPQLITPDGAITTFVNNIERRLFAARPVAVVGVEPSAGSMRTAIATLREQARTAGIKTQLQLGTEEVDRTFDKLDAFVAGLSKTTKFIETGGFDVLMSKFDVITSRYVDLATLMANVPLSPSTQTAELENLLTLLKNIKAEINGLKGTSIGVTVPQPTANQSAIQPNGVAVKGPIQSGFSLRDLNEQTKTQESEALRAYTEEVEAIENLRKQGIFNQSTSNKLFIENEQNFNRAIKSIYEERTAIISDAISQNQIDSAVAANELAKSEQKIKTATNNLAKIEKGETDEEIAKRIAAQEKAEIDSIERIAKAQRNSLNARLIQERESLNKELEARSISEDDARQRRKQLELEESEALARIYNDRTAALQDSISRGLLSEKAAAQEILNSRAEVLKQQEKINRLREGQIKPNLTVSDSLVTDKNDFQRRVDTEKQQTIRSIGQLDISDYKTGVAAVEKLEADLNTKLDKLYRDRLETLRQFNTSRVVDQQYVGQEIIDLENKVADNTSRNLRKLEADAKSVRGVINFSRISDEFKEAALQIGVYGTIFAAAGLPFQIAKTAIELQKYAALIKSVTRDNQDATESFAMVRDLVQDYGLQLEPLIAGYGKLRAAAKDTGLTIEETNKLFRGIALASGGLQLSADETTGTIKAFTDALSKGTFQAEELKGQLGDRLVGAFNLVAESLGKTPAQLTDALKQGSVQSVQVARALSVTLEQEYGGAALAASKTTQGLLNSINSSFAAFSEKLGEDLLPIVDNTLGAINGMLEGLADNSSIVIPLLTGVAAGIALIATKGLLLDLIPISMNAVAIGAAKMATSISALQGQNNIYVANTKKLTESQAGLAAGLGLSAKSIGANIAIVGAVTVGITAATIAYDNLTAKSQTYEKALKNILEIEERLAVLRAGGNNTQQGEFGAEKRIKDKLKAQQESPFSYFDPRTSQVPEKQLEEIFRKIRNNEKLQSNDFVGIGAFEDLLKIMNEYNSSIEMSSDLFDRARNNIKENAAGLDELRSKKIRYNEIKQRENSNQLITEEEAKFLREYERLLERTTKGITEYGNEVKSVQPENGKQLQTQKELNTEYETQAKQLRSVTLDLQNYIETTTEAERITSLLQKQLALGSLFSTNKDQFRDNKDANQAIQDELELAKIAKQIKEAENRLAAESDLDKRRQIEQEILELQIQNRNKLDEIEERNYNRQKERDAERIKKRLEKELAAIDESFRADKRALDERERSYNRIKFDLDVIGKNLERQNTLLSVQRDLAKSISELRTARAEQALSLTNETNDVGKQLKESRTKIEELQAKIQEAYFGEKPDFKAALEIEKQLAIEVGKRKELEKQSKELRQATGRPDRLPPGVSEEQDAIISRQIQESNLAKIKFDSLQEQFAFERQLLDIDFKKQENALKLLQIEQEIAAVKLRGEQRSARRDLETAQSQLRNLGPDATDEDKRQAQNRVEDALFALEGINEQIGLNDRIRGNIRDQFGDLNQNRDIRGRILDNREQLERERFQFEQGNINRRNRNELAGIGVDPNLAPQLQPIQNPVSAQQLTAQFAPVVNQQTTQLVSTINTAASRLEQAIRSSAAIINVEGVAKAKPSVPLPVARNL